MGRAEIGAKGKGGYVQIGGAGNPYKNKGVIGNKNVSVNEIKLNLIIVTKPREW